MKKILFLLFIFLSLNLHADESSLDLNEGSDIEQTLPAADELNSSDNFYNKFEEREQKVQEIESQILPTMESNDGITNFGDD